MSLEIHESHYSAAGQRVVNAIKGIDARRREFFRGSVDSPWTIETRLKTNDSIASKLERKRRLRPDYRLSDMTDIIGVRAIVDSPAMAANLAAIMRDAYRVRDAEDFGDKAREDGYRGIHLVLEISTETRPIHTIAVELQIRTILQHQWSVLSHSEFYKTLSEIPPSMLARMQALSEILHCAEIESEQLRRGRILDACGRRVHDVLVQQINGLHGSPANSESVGRTALHLLEFDTTLRRTLISHGDAQRRAFAALEELSSSAASGHDAAMASALTDIVHRVRVVVEPCHG